MQKLILAATLFFVNTLLVSHSYSQPALDLTKTYSDPSISAAQVATYKSQCIKWLDEAATKGEPIDPQGYATSGQLKGMVHVVEDSVTSLPYDDTYGCIFFRIEINSDGTIKSSKVEYTIGTATRAAPFKFRRFATFRIKGQQAPNSIVVPFIIHLNEKFEMFIRMF